MRLFFTSSNYPKCKLICTSGNFELVKKSPTPNCGWRKQSKSKETKLCEQRDVFTEMFDAIMTQKVHSQSCPNK